MTKMTPVAEKRAATYDEMTPALKKVAEKFRELATKEARGGVLVKYDMGVQILDVLSDAGVPKYGENAVDQLAMYLNRSTTELYDFRTFAQTYTREEVDALCQQEMENGDHPAAGHFLAIMRVRKAVDRKALWKRVFAENLTVRAVTEEVNAAFEKANTRAGGRKPAKPSSPIAGVQQIVESTGTILNRVTVWRENVYDQMAALEPERVDPQTVQKLAKAIENMDKVTEEFSQDRAKLYTAWERANKIVEERTAAQNQEAKAEEDALDGKEKKGKGAKGRKPVTA